MATDQQQLTTIDDLHADAVAGEYDRASQTAERLESKAEALQHEQDAQREQHHLQRLAGKCAAARYAALCHGVGCSPRRVPLSPERRELREQRSHEHLPVA